MHKPTTNNTEHTNEPFTPPAHINTTIDRRPDGTPITIADRITEYVRTGQFIELAAAAVGVKKDTLYSWLKNAARTRLRAKGRPLNQLDLSTYQKDCIEFSDRVLMAASQWANKANWDLERLGRGGIPVTKTTVTERFKIDPNDNEHLIERVRVTVNETTLPDKQVLMWRLERRLPNFYGARVEIETTGADATPRLADAEVSESLADAVEDYLKDREPESAVGSVSEQVDEVAAKPRQRRDERGKVIEDAVDQVHRNGDG